MECQRSEIAPASVAAAKLNESREKHQPKEQQPKQPPNRPVKFVGRWPMWQQFKGRRKDRQKSHFKKQDVPLIAKKCSRNVEQGEVKKPEQQQHNWLSQADQLSN